MLSDEEIQGLDGEMMMVQDIPCQVRLQEHQWIALFSYREEPVCLRLCKEYDLPDGYIRTMAQWMIADYLEDRRFEELCQNSMN